ncbi:hypothetical protein HU230_0011820 [Bradyrhizobium quebecense]|uniref:Uncharacterized protein n=1 Tax=Bradyrhizobium quebecense TaxID=2748629 RepID=A0A974AET4_9BRAD|nr:hypothetical protein [Bradyrhizobium quebecense]UGA46682.1 hypothetical protein HU230_0011820 [Bradyrhizobium quebecense]
MVDTTLIAAERGEANPFLSKDAGIVHALPRLNLTPAHASDRQFRGSGMWPRSAGCCLYDLKTGTFSVPASLAEYNEKARKIPGKDPHQRRPEGCCRRLANCRIRPQKTGISGTNQYFPPTALNH